MPPMKYSRRAFGFVDPDEEERQQRLLEYQIYQEAFQVALSDSLVSAARSRSHEIFMSFRLELQLAKEAVEEGHRLLLAGGVGSFDALLVSWFRAYRAIEWYESELGTAIANAVTEPFSHYLKPGSPLKAREFFRPAALRGLREEVLTVMFEPAAFVSAVKAFFGGHQQIRHTIAHGIYQPKLPESKGCVTDAIAIYTLVDNKLYSMPTPLDPPDLG
jgi:hypothetical protein